jgi:hypothetical protein
MRFRTVAIALAGGVLGLAVTVGNAPAGIGIFSDTDGASCDLTLGNFVASPVYVLYVGKGGPQALGAEYRIAGMPGTLDVTYFATMTPAPGSNLNLGHAFDGVGHAVAWAAAQPFDANGNLLLATYTLFQVGPPVPAGTVLKAMARNPPCDSCGCSFLGFPVLVGAQYDLICQPGGEMRVNGGPSCTVAVEARTWTEVRNLYR